ncbi:hypothetical protein FNV43_RR15273 [Rhamnella rubrinervis]|uniref:AAA+ ATPase domain-containing protein n=1 Tax=Rhamnella rubrinervis TaxID=2594499 RepID=A0A8K0E8H3_9ROSA|nr:hypothetical protein FNV43_RR15273 [Rhamnella rubrinervis]
MKWMMANPRRNSYSNNQSLESSLHGNTFSYSSSTVHFLKKPHAFAFLLSVFLLLTWVSLRLQHSAHFSSSSSSRIQNTNQHSNQLDDSQANLMRFPSGFPSRIAKDKRGWLLSPVSLALDSAISGGALTCTSVHIGEIRPGAMRGNHRHYSCNETFVIWGAKTKFRLENSQVVDKGYAEVVVGADEVAVAASPSGRAHALALDMPSSKGKKHSKTPSRVSNSEHYESPQTPSSTHSRDIESREGDLVYFLEEASRKYPSLIGKSAFIGQVIDVEHDSKGFKIWLSESSMVASSFIPGSIVSVSFPSLNSKLSYSFPLSSLADECARHFGIDPGNQLADEAGNYFALATIFPSSKVAKNQVRLSAGLSNTMGCPTSGKDVFVFPAQNQLLAGLVSKREKPDGGKGDHFMVHDCNELVLELVHSRNRLLSRKTSMSISSEKSYHHSASEVLASPKTPLNQSKISFSNICQSASSTCEDPTVNSTISDGSSVIPFNIMEVLEDEASKKLLQTCATTWLYSCCLLRGNIVTIPMLSQQYSFQVIGAKNLLTNSTHDLVNESNNGNLHEASEVVDRENEAFLVKRETKICLGTPAKLAYGSPKRQGMSRMDSESGDAKGNARDTISNLGGLSKEYALLKDIIVSSSSDPLSRFGLRPKKGVLLHGPPGTGKTTLARLCARDAGVKLFSVNGPEIISPYSGESERSLHKVFDSAAQAAPAVVFIDELDAIAPARKDGSEELSQTMVATLLNLMDGISRTEGLLVIAATNRPDCIDPALRRPGRLDKEIEIGVPSTKQRLDILLSLLSEMDHSLLDTQAQHLARVTHGFVGADLAALCNEAVLVCLYRFAKSRSSCLHRASVANEECSDVVTESDCLKVTGNISRDYSDTASSPISHLAVSSQNLLSLLFRLTISDGIHDIENDIEEECMLKVTFEDFEKARMRVRPSAMREVILEVPKVNWEDVGGQREVKSQLMEAVEWPQVNQNALKRIGTRPPSGVLLYGPPGCSKTLIARAVASKAGLNFLAVKGPELFSKWVGESEKAVKSLFAKARANAPSIIFFDEIDGLATIRGKESDEVSVSDRVITQLLTELDGLHQRANVTVIAATNRPDKIDRALLRQGRFDRLVYVGPPNESDREEIFHIHLRKIPCSSDVSIKDLARLTEGFTGADISLICREAALAALEESFDASEIRMQHLQAAIRQVQPSEIQSYKALAEKFRRIVASIGKEGK